MSFRHTLKRVLKRGALVAAANWPVILAQSAADALFKLLIAAPLVGGVILATLVIGADISALTTGDWRLLAAEVVTSLLQHRIVLLAFVLSLAVVVLGGSLFVFLMKAGTLGVLVRGERQAGDVETPPLQLEVVASAASFTIELFVESARALFPRYARLGLVLMAVYAVSAGTFAAMLVWVPAIAESWGYTSLITLAFVVWTTLVNLIYLLVQIVIAVDDCTVMLATRRVMAFLRSDRRMVTAVFGVILAMILFATGASLLAMFALGLIFLVPLVGFAAIPLNLIAFLLRALVFQYIELSAVGAYLTLYRGFSLRAAADSVRPAPYVAWAPPADVQRP